MEDNNSIETLLVIFHILSFSLYFRLIMGWKSSSECDSQHIIHETGAYTANQEYWLQIIISMV